MLPCNTKKSSMKFFFASSTQENSFSVAFLRDVCLQRQHKRKILRCVCRQICLYFAENRVQFNNSWECIVFGYRICKIFCERKSLRYVKQFFYMKLRTSKIYVRKFKCKALQCHLCCWTHTDTTVSYSRVALLLNYYIMHKIYYKKNVINNIRCQARILRRRILFAYLSLSHKVSLFMQDFPNNNLCISANQITMHIQKLTRMYNVHK